MLKKDLERFLAMIPGNPRVFAGYGVPIDKVAINDRANDINLLKQADVVYGKEVKDRRSSERRQPR